MIDATLLDPNLMQNVSDMLQLAIMSCNRPPKAIAAEIGYSLNAIYGALKGVRSIPTKARRKISQVNFIAAAAVALESTGFTKLFGNQKVDRHIQSMIIRMKRYDKETAPLIDKLPELLLDKNCRDDLTPDELVQVENTAKMLISRINCTINLVMELEVKYKLNLTAYL